MRLVTFRTGDEPHAGVLIDDTRAVHLHAADPEIPDSVRAILAGGESTLARVRAAVEAPAAQHTVTISDDHPLDAPVPDATKMMAIGLNYRAHAEEVGLPIPERPIVFAKWPNTIVATGQPVIVPAISHRVDWEGELCVVIGRRGRHIPASEALDYVGGYMNSNDVSVRDWQAHAATWTMGKNFDTHTPLGPWLLTTDEAPDPSAFQLRTYVNDVLKQDSSTSDLIFDVPALIEYLSTAMTLEPGDLILTGTPSGVGQSRNPREWLKPGDTVRVEITGLGSLENPLVAEE
jgi:2-keto-4-pentenoate hydratase/2-oxohepta-3-ene-1,7-dioic acid hydratase in catechol pathway